MISIVSDMEQCRCLWKGLIRPLSLFDIWEVRACFQKHYGYRPAFIVLKHAAGSSGLLALSWIEEYGYLGYFPGETYRGKTWLEQNRLVAPTSVAASELVNQCDMPMHLRYLTEPWPEPSASWGVDELGYLFRPTDYGYCFDRYLQSFSAKRRKGLTREMASFVSCGITYRYNDLSDIHRVFDLNLNAFGDQSYFADKRFLAAFKEWMLLLNERDLLRITAVLVGGQIAAIDLGAVYRGVYTVLAGGTHPGFKGIAKVINCHHMEWACSERLDLVDFLCGDFSWKERFHLTPRPLYQFRKSPVEHTECVSPSGVLTHAE
ncbi:MAG: GNAT family N-acetyltransferase [Phycisphaeraceae bacterium]|nr:GNAT family N-acetyltransferase [Phycisphaeraceae bacterium]